MSGSRHMGAGLSIKRRASWSTTQCAQRAVRCAPLRYSAMNLVRMWMAAVLACVSAVPGGISQEIQSLTVKAGDSVTLQTGLTGLRGEHILWVHSSNLTLLFCEGGALSNIPQEYKGRLNLDQTTGSLSITSIEKNAVYRAEILQGNKLHKYLYNVTVETKPSNSAAGPRSLWGLIVAAAVCFLLLNN